MHAGISGKIDWVLLAATIKTWGRELGFADIGITHVDLSHAEAGLLQWLAAGYHGEMDYMARHGLTRARPAELVPGTVSVITARLDYRPTENMAADAGENLSDPARAYLSRYALGRDYHKVLRNKLQALADRINAELDQSSDGSEFKYRAFTDSAPVMEVELAAMSGLGWRGKHTLLLNRAAGSYFFLGELFTNLPLPADAPTSNHCGTCQACIDICPTQAFVTTPEGRHVLDARRCISYLTIELKGEIPVELRPLIGNRVYGCDDCQLACPWNRFSPLTRQDDFKVRHGLDQATLVELFAWTEEEFNQRLAGSAIRRIGHERWLRNLAVGLGNIPADHPAAAAAIAALEARQTGPSALVREHVAWALQRLRA
ncbi:MAG: tRNA epoxyqueuosine(34) reductase QueG [Rhodocyclaceae bacterium]|nr:tRNA epoxyqueuosine(34) reductase QueG [Rhodocyclaceae bacterium]